MKRGTSFAMVVLLVTMLCAPLLAQDEKPMEKTAALTDISLSKHWKLGPSITIPPLRVQESLRNDAKLDVVLTASVGGGLSFQYVQTDPLTGTEERVFTWSPFTILLSGNSVEDMTNIDLSYAMTVGFFNDLIMTGFGYNFGDNVSLNEAGETVELSRWFFLLGLGVSFR